MLCSAPGLRGLLSPTHPSDVNAGDRHALERHLVAAAGVDVRVARPTDVRARRVQLSALRRVTSAR